MEVEVLFYGRVSETTGLSSTKYQDVKNIDALLNLLKEKFPKLQNLQYTMALNQVIVNTNTTFKNGDIIAILPPFAGG